MAENMSTREKLSQLMDLVVNDQNNAIRETASFLGSSEAQAFRAKIAAFQERTVPGSPFDQIYGSLVKVFDSVKEMADKVVAPPDANAQGKDLGVPVPAQEG